MANGHTTAFKIAWGLAAGLISVSISVAAWLGMAVIDRPTFTQTEAMIIDKSVQRSEVGEMVETYAPYKQDRQRILSSIQLIENKFVTSVQKNTEAIVRLESTLDHLLEVRPAEVLKAVQEVKKEIEQIKRDK